MTYLRSFNRVVIVSIILIVSSANAYATTAAIKWQTLARGLEYTQIKQGASLYSGAIHIFKVDLNHYLLKSVKTHNSDKKLQSIAELSLAHHALIGINGGFFDHDNQSLGLRVNNNKIVNPIKITPWWGVFFIRGEKAYIVPQKAFHFSNAIDFAIQSGPRLIVNGKIPTLKPGLANRTALGITANNKVIILVTERHPLMINELAKIMQRPESEGGLSCVHALNLDGGSSTQLYAKINNFKLDVKSFSYVADAVLVVPEKS